MRVTILHNAVSEEDPPDARDVLVQVAAVSGALEGLGHQVAVLPVTLDLSAMVEALTRDPPALVFNLVESLLGTGRLIAHAPALLDVLGLPYTGACSEAVYLTSNKLLAKGWLRAAGLPTPPTLGLYPLAHPQLPSERVGGAAVLVKSLWEHASIGLDEDRVVRGAPPDEALLAARAAELGGACFAEPYVDGREFNISLLGLGDGEAEVLPHAEISFDAFPPEKLRIVGYRAKWAEGSFEYENTPRRFDFAAGDGALLETLSALSRAAWRCFGLRGHARVDFRVDPAGQPWILEVNPNPCLSPDAGFAAAATRAGLSFEALVERIVADVPGLSDHLGRER